MTTPEGHKQGLIRRLLLGEKVIKEGHRVQKLNPEGERVVVSLGSNQIGERILQLAQMVKNKELPSTDAEVMRIRQKYSQFDYLFK